MNLYLIKPCLTMDPNEIADDFFRHCFDELSHYIDIIQLGGISRMKQLQGGKDTVIIFFNGKKGVFPPVFQDCIMRCKEAGSQFYPIAISGEYLMPLNIIDYVQSYDIEEEIKRRNLTDKQYKFIAQKFARFILSQLQPTLTKVYMSLFISYRRTDGDHVATELFRQFHNASENVFKDRMSILCGEDAQDVIEKNLRASECMILIDSPQSAESVWVEKEIKLAMIQRIPILWVKLLTAERVSELPIKPLETPHFEIHSVADIDETLIYDMLNKAFQLSREFSLGVFDQRNTLLQVAKGAIETLDKRHMIDKIQIQRKELRYRQRPFTQIIQWFGRKPDISEIETLHDFVDRNYQNSNFDMIIDSALLLSNNFSEDGQDKIISLEEIDKYLVSIQKYINPESDTSKQRKRIIISGSFPDTDKDYQQNLSNAMFCFILLIFTHNMEIVFGAHPTFQNLIFDLAKLYSTAHYKEVVHMYVSRFFTDECEIKKFQEVATVYDCESCQTKEDSLSVMRRKMIEESNACAMICLGGKIDSAGIDEEIQIARQQRIPIFVIGTTGGRAAQIASMVDERCDMNTLDNSDKEKLLNSNDYMNLANMILQNINKR